MNENIFRRVEQKYIITKSERDELMKMIDGHLVPDDYYESHISNIYFDNSHNDMLIESLEKPMYKIKVRLRSYDEYITPQSKVFLEIKEKYKGIVGKRRIALKFKDYLEYMNTGKLCDEQIAHEIDYYFKKYDLHPYIYVAYDRLSYRASDDDSIRITIDSNLRSRLDNLEFESKESKNYFEDDTYIVEIKLLNAMPLWLTSALSSLHIYPASFSKVGSIYTKLKIKERSEILC